MDRETPLPINNKKEIKNMLKEEDVIFALLQLLQQYPGVQAEALFGAINDIHQPEGNQLHLNTPDGTYKVEVTFIGFKEE